MEATNVKAFSLGESSALRDAIRDSLSNGGAWINLIAAEDGPGYLEAIERMRQSGAGVVAAYRIRVGSETVIHVVDYLTPLFDSNRSMSGFIGRAVDDSFRIQMMNTLASRSWKEVSSIATRRFLHEFNNMIAGIYSLSELYAIPGSDAETLTEAMTHIRDSASRAQSITQKIRALITMGSGDKSYFEVRKLIEEQSDYLLAILPKTVELRLELSEASLPVHLDANRFRQALIHLASNANDAAIGNPHIVIRCRESGPQPSRKGKRMASIEFHDDGQGMESTALEKAAEPFFTTKDASAHAGMGLFVVKEFVESLGGEFSIASSPGKGTRVAILLPVAEIGDSEPSNESGSDAAPDLSEGIARRKPNVLIYTWEDITRHPLINSIRSSGWSHRIHLDSEQMQLDIREFGEGLDGVVVFKSALDENVERLIDDIASMDAAPKLAVVALGESVEAVAENVRSKCGILVSGSAKPAGLLETLRKYFS